MWRPSVCIHVVKPFPLLLTHHTLMQVWDGILKLHLEMTWELPNSSLNQYLWTGTDFCKSLPYFMTKYSLAEKQPDEQKENRKFSQGTKFAKVRGKTITKDMSETITHWCAWGGLGAMKGHKWACPPWAVSGPGPHQNQNEDSTWRKLQGHVMLVSLPHQWF